MVFIGEVGVLIYLKTSLARRAGARRSIRGLNAKLQVLGSKPIDAIKAQPLYGIAPLWMFIVL